MPSITSLWRAARSRLYRRFCGSVPEPAQIKGTPSSRPWSLRTLRANSNSRCFQGDPTGVSPVYPECPASVGAEGVEGPDGLEDNGGRKGRRGRRRAHEAQEAQGKQERGASEKRSVIVVKGPVARTDHPVRASPHFATAQMSGNG
ncbi:unnamed protein product [Cutaneotrichosporon oleaginosum]